MSVRAWPADFPEDIAVQRRVPYESRADSIMYCQVLADVAQARGWDVRGRGPPWAASGAGPTMVEGPPDGTRGHSPQRLTWRGDGCRLPRGRWRRGTRDDGF